MIWPNIPGLQKRLVRKLNIFVTDLDGDVTPLVDARRSESGVVVVAQLSGSNALDTGLEAGDIIRAVEGIAICLCVRLEGRADHPALRSRTSTALQSTSQSETPLSRWSEFRSSGTRVYGVKILWVAFGPVLEDHCLHVMT
jgi:hypothetical protein